MINSDNITTQTNGSSQLEATQNLVDEETPLIQSTSTTANNSSMSNGSAEIETENSSTNSSLEDENEKLWPATFERSISLLAGPQMDSKAIDLMTRSPRVVPPHLAQARRALMKFDRTYFTPPPQPNRHEISSPIQFKKPLKKIKSLDFPHEKQQQQQESESRMDKEEMRLRQLKEAHAYRQQILAKASVGVRDETKETTLVQHSPGYQREMAYKKESMIKKGKEGGDGGHGIAVKDASSFSQCVFNLCNILMGVGLLGLPFVSKSAGWVLGVGILLFFSFVTWRTSILIGRELNGDPRPGHLFDDSPYKSPLAPGSTPAARLRPPIRSFPDIARESFGNIGAILLSIVLYFELFSCMAIFLVSLGDHLHAVIPQYSVTHHIVIVAFVAVLPVIILRTARLLSYLSAVGTFATIAVVFSVCIYALVDGDMTSSMSQVSSDTGGVIQNAHTAFRPRGIPLALGLIAYCFSGHAIVPSIYSSMRRPQDYEQMVHVTYIVVVAVCVLVAGSGYYMFGNYVDDQVTLTLESTMRSANEHIVTKALTWLMILTAFSKFVLTCYPLALGIEEIISPCIASEEVMYFLDAIIKIILIVLSLTLGAFCPYFSLLCSLVGLVCTMIVSVIFPAAAHMKLFWHHIGWGERLLDIIFLVGGIFSAIVGTWATVGL